MPSPLTVVDPVVDLMRDIARLAEVLDMGMVVDCMGEMSDQKIASLRRFLAASEELVTALEELQAHIRADVGMRN